MLKSVTLYQEGNNELRLEAKFTDGSRFATHFILSMNKDAFGYALITLGEEIVGESNA